MSKIRKLFFCQQLAELLLAADWHFTTLLAVCIDSIERLPDDADRLVNRLLLSFPERASARKLEQYLTHSTIVENWFCYSVVKPRIKTFSLTTENLVSHIESNLPPFESPAVLAHWLGISESQLDWFTDQGRLQLDEPEKFKHYHYGLVSKRRGGVRLIESPKTRLKQIQRKIHRDILIRIPVHNAAHGFVETKNIVSHAQNHTNKKFLFTFDLSDFFMSVGWYAIYKVFLDCGYNSDTAKSLSSLCTHRYSGPNSILKRLDFRQRAYAKESHLAQGAPTSPMLSNLAARTLDSRLTALAERLGLSYSRYADDLAFSGNTRRDWRFFEPLVGSICLEEGFELNYRKSRFVRSHQRQKITGAIVNNGVNIDRRYYDRLKATLTNCLRYGAASQNVEGHADLQAVLLGRVLFVKSLNSNKGDKLLKLYHQIDFGER